MIWFAPVKELGYRHAQALFVNLVRFRREDVPARVGGVAAVGKIAHNNLIFKDRG